MRNGIPCKSFGDKLFKNPTDTRFLYEDDSWGIERAHFETFARERPGVMPGSNWGFSRATRAQED